MSREGYHNRGSRVLLFSFSCSFLGQEKKPSRKISTAPQTLRRGLGLNLFRTDRIDSRTLVLALSLRFPRWNVMQSCFFFNFTGLPLTTWRAMLYPNSPDNILLIIRTPWEISCLGRTKWQRTGDPPASSLHRSKPPPSVRLSSAPANGAVDASLMRAKGLRGLPCVHSTHRFRAPVQPNRRVRGLIDYGGATTPRRTPPRFADRGQNRTNPTKFQPPWNLIYTQHRNYTAQTLLDNYRCNGGGSPLYEPNQFLLQVALSPRSFQIFNAPEVIHNVFRFAEVNLETEKQPRPGQRGRSKRRTPCNS